MLRVEAQDKTARNILNHGISGGLRSIHEQLQFSCPPRVPLVRVLNPPVDGRLMHGESGVDVGDQIAVKLIHTDPQRGFIDFARQASEDH